MSAAARCEPAPAPAPARPSCAPALLARLDHDLPLDPRQWSRRDVGAWALRRGAHPERFPMNGKALCLMSADMFAAREPGLGARLHQDFRRRLGKALALQELLEKLMAK